MHRELLIGDDDRVRAFVGRINRRIPDFGVSRAIGVLVDGELIAGIVYNEFRERQLTMHVSALNPSWASRRIVGELLATAFVTNNCVRVNAVVSATNRKVQKFLKQLGFSCEGMHPLGWMGTEIALSFGMTRDQAAKWLVVPEEKSHGQIQPVATSRA